MTRVLFDLFFHIFEYQINNKKMHFEFSLTCCCLHLTVLVHKQHRNKQFQRNVAGRFVSEYYLSSVFNQTPKVVTISFFGTDSWCIAIPIFLDVFCLFAQRTWLMTCDHSIVNCAPQILAHSSPYWCNW